jgi:hypothetical protein
MKPNFAGNVRQALQSLNYEVDHRIFSEARKGHQRVKVWGFRAEDLAEVENAMRVRFGDRVLSVYHVVGYASWTYPTSLVVEIAK